MMLERHRTRNLEIITDVIGDKWLKGSHQIDIENIDGQGTRGSKLNDFGIKIEEISSYHYDRENKFITILTRLNVSYRIYSELIEFEKLLLSY